MQDVAMALVHETRPSFGVQFHPESICTSFGAQLVHNFLALALAVKPGLLNHLAPQPEPHSTGRSTAAGAQHSQPLGPTRSAAHLVGSPSPSPCGSMEPTSCSIPCLQVVNHPFRYRGCAEWVPAYDAAL